MAVERESSLSAGPAHERLSDLLKQLSAEGLTQLQVALQASVPAQYLSDIKCGRRPMTELVARRIGQEFDVNFEWLMGTSDVVRTPQPASDPAYPSSSMWLPVFPHPIEGEPRQNPHWDANTVEIAGVEAAKAALAKQPYILRYGHDDKQGRFHQGDLILISQLVDEDAEVSVVRHQGAAFLARKIADQTWERAFKGTIFKGCKPVGHCLGIIWSAFKTS